MWYCDGIPPSYSAKTIVGACLARIQMGKKKAYEKYWKTVLLSFKCFKVKFWNLNLNQILMIKLTNNKKAERGVPSRKPPSWHPLHRTPLSQNPSSTEPPSIAPPSQHSHFMAPLSRHPSSWHPLDSTTPSLDSTTLPCEQNE